MNERGQRQLKRIVKNSRVSSTMAIVKAFNSGKSKKEQVSLMTIRRYLKKMKIHKLSAAVKLDLNPINSSKNSEKFLHAESKS